MNCQEVRTVIDGYVDGELDPIRNREIEQHLEGCAECSKICNSHQALQATLRGSFLRSPAPMDLRTRIQSSVHHASKAEPASHGMPWRWLGIAASLAVVAIFTWRLMPFQQGPAADDLLLHEVTSSHVRSLMANHLVDIPSSDRHVVKPWFTGKLDFAPSVADLTERGFPLVGGRLEYLNGRAVAGLVYKRREHVINVFLWPSPDASSQETKPIVRQGYHLLRWTQSGMTYWAVSDLNSRELQEFVHLLQNPTPR